MCEFLVSDSDQIIAKLLHGVRCLSWLYCLWVMCDEDRLKRLNDHYSLFSLYDSQLGTASMTSEVNL